ncbi:MAG: methionine adenosyltransferase [candidate division WOR-3 bacterium]
MATYVRELVFPPVENMGVEIVERKGLGHPDTICDALSETYSAALSMAYMERFGRIYHHNVDKALLVGGSAKPAFSGGEITSPIEIHMVGRVTDRVMDERVPIDEIYRESARKWIKESFRHLDPDKHLIFNLIVRPGSQDLVELFERSYENPLANDTSFGVGFAPMTTTENLVYSLEKYLNGPFRREHPFVGEDIKIMGVRSGRKINITVAMAMVGKAIASLEQYREAKELVKQKALEFAASITPWEVWVDVNAADSIEKGSVYITVTGTSAESGDDGQVGRGNRANGLITPYRPMSLEAAAGKNPVSHVGKTYNVLAREIADEVVRRVDEVTEAYAYIVSQIGKPVTEPQLLDIHVRTKSSLTVGVRERVAEIAERKLQDAPVVWRRVMAGEVELF